jgi:GNAT superfamily N-acetyltransferase
MNIIGIKLEECAKWIIKNFCDFSMKYNVTDNKTEEYYSITNLKDLLYNTNITVDNYQKYKLQIFNILSQLTNAPILTDNTLKNIIMSQNISNTTYAYISNGDIIGLMTIIIEQKLIHGGMCVAHIEDLVVDKNCRGKNVGRNLIKYAISYASLNNCYKIILDCYPNLMEYYEKSQFYSNSICMRYDLPMNNIIIRQHV